MLKISGFQPSSPTAMIKMLAQSIDRAEVTVDASEASVKEAKAIEISHELANYPKSRKNQEDCP